MGAHVATPGFLLQITSTAAAPPPRSLLPEIGPDGITRENPVIVYTERACEGKSISLSSLILLGY